MYRWSPFPFVRIVLLLATGIFFSLNYDLSIALLTSVLVLLFLVHLALGKAFEFNRYKLNGVIPFAILFLLGMLRTEFEKVENDDNHWIHHESSRGDLIVKIAGYPVEKEAHYIYEARALAHILEKERKVVSGKFSLYLRKDSTTIDALRYGDVLLINKLPFQISPPNNPHEFDYRRYMSFKQIHHQVFINSTDYLVIGQEVENTLLSISFDIRRYFKEKLEEHVIDDDSRAIAYALLLGIKDDINADLKKAYSSAGAMHVLAVSGLHVGIIFLLVTRVFSFLRKFRYGKYLLLILSLFFLWAYAFVTGLSPSVLRAVVMFSVIIIGKESARYANIYNSLAISAVIILLYDPYMLTRVGFQLSYLAVLGIVYLQPRIYNLMSFNNFLLDKIWALTCVSIAAQLATFPLGLYYFHQFPTYFLVSNLFVIPMAFIILLMGIILLVVSAFHDGLGSFVGGILDWTIELLNSLVSWINTNPMSLIEWIYFDSFQTILIYLLILAVIFIFHFKKGRYVWYAYSFLVLLIGYSVFLRHESSTQNSIVFYELRQNSAIDFISGHNASVYVNNPDDELALLQFQMGPNRLANYVGPLERQDFNKLSQPLNQWMDLIKWKDKRIVIIHSEIKDFTLGGKIEADYVVISNNAIRQLSWIANVISCEKFILDSSNATYLIKSLEKQAERLKIKVHNIKKQGALVVSV